MRILKDNADIKKISLINELQKDQLIYSDKNVINLVLRNIISNAIKFTEHGGKIKIDSRPINGVVEIGMSDTGIGISKELLPEIFTNDVKSTSGTGNESGTGLGLMLCKELIEKTAAEFGPKVKLAKEVDLLLLCQQSQTKFS